MDTGFLLYIKSYYGRGLCCILSMSIVICVSSVGCGIYYTLLLMVSWSIMVKFTSPLACSVVNNKGEMMLEEIGYCIECGVYHGNQDCIDTVAIKCGCGGCESKLTVGIYPTEGVDIKVNEFNGITLNIKGIKLLIEALQSALES